MKKVVEEVTKYITSDGRTFYDLKTAEDHERSIIERVKCNNEYKKVYDKSSQFEYLNANGDTIKAIVCHDEEEYNTIKSYIEIVKGDEVDGRTKEIFPCCLISDFDYYDDEITYYVCHISDIMNIYETYESILKELKGENKK